MNMLSTPKVRSCFSLAAALVLGVLIAGAQSANAQAPGSVLISEFRYSGPGGNNDSYIELFNTTANDLDISGWAVVDNSGNARKVLAAGSIIPARGFYLLTKNNGYTLSSLATADDTYNSALGQDQGIGLFNNSTTFNASTLVDAVGTTAVGEALFKEGAPIAALGNNNSDYAWVRRYNGQTGEPIDTNDNAADFRLVNTTGAAINGVTTILGNPAPNNRASAEARANTIKSSLIDPTQPASAAPNRVRLTRAQCDANIDPNFRCNDDNSTNGTLGIRRRFRNNTTGVINQIKFEVLDTTTLNNQAAGEADVRFLSSEVLIPPASCIGCGPGKIDVEKTPAQQTLTVDLGGGLNSRGAAGTLPLPTPLAPGASVVVEFRLGVQQSGNFRFFVNVHGSFAPSAPAPASKTVGAAKMKN
jgi:Lamin Tail Domain